MTKDTTIPAALAGQSGLFENWFDEIETGVRARVRGFIETMLEEELDETLSRPRYGRRKPEAPDSEPVVAGHRHGHRKRTLTGTFGKTDIDVPRARLAGADGKDVVSRTWRKVKSDWEAWNGRSLKDDKIVRLILDGTVVRVRLDRQATSICLLVALGVRDDGQKVLLAVKNMGGESEAAWRALLDDLAKRGMGTPDLVIVDGGSGLETALACLWSDVPVQRCTVHKH